MLPNEVVSLIHHIELNKAGWREKTIQQLILSSLWLAKKPIRERQLIDGLYRDYSLNTTRQEIRNQIGILEDDDTVIRLANNRYKLSETYIRRLTHQIQESERVADAVEKYFAQLLTEFGFTSPTPPVWKDFNENYLLPTIEQIGARTYQLISGDEQYKHWIGLEEFLLRYPEIERDNLQKALGSFLAEQNDDVRLYILQLLNAYFSVEATKLSEETLNAIHDPELKPEFTLYLDTNFLFSFLG